MWLVAAVLDSKTSGSKGAGVERQPCDGAIRGASQQKTDQPLASLWQGKPQAGNGKYLAQAPLLTIPAPMADIASQSPHTFLLVQP